MNKAVPVSVVVPCYRCSLTLERAVESVAAQTRRPVELILVDDASNDETAKLLEALVARYEAGWIKIRWLDGNVGAASARNIGWAAATQPLVAFLDADDAWHAEKLAIQYAYMRAHPAVALSGHKHRLLTQDAALNWKVAEARATTITKWSLLLSNRFVTPSVMVRRDVRHRFVENQRHMEDHMLWLQVLMNGGCVVKLDSELAAIYKEPFGTRGLSAQIWLMERGELGNYRRLFAAGFIKSHEFAMLCVYSLLKYIRRLVIYGAYLRWKQKP
jgi:glycosyltransferase involved in cell wall biosynthesis